MRILISSAHSSRKNEAAMKEVIVPQEKEKPLSHRG